MIIVLEVMLNQLLDMYVQLLVLIILQDHIDIVYHHLNYVLEIILIIHQILHLLHKNVYNLVVIIFIRIVVYQIVQHHILIF